jgi:hypothetical protein
MSDVLIILLMGLLLWPILSWTRIKLMLQSNKFYLVQLQTNLTSLFLVLGFALSFQSYRLVASHGQGNRRLFG